MPEPVEGRTLTPAQVLALRTLAANEGRACYISSRSSRVDRQWVNARAVESLRKMGLASVSMFGAVDTACITEQGHAALAALTAPARVQSPDGAT